MSLFYHDSLGKRRLTFQTHVAAVFAMCVVVLAFSGGAGAQAACQPRRNASFQVFDTMNYRNQPDMSAYGMSRVHVIDRGFWTDEKARTTVDTRKLQRVMDALPDDGGLVVMDIEHLSLGLDNPKTAQNVKTLGSIARQFRAASSRPIGYYGVYPLPDYSRSIAPPTSAKFLQWRRDNDAIGKLDRDVDVLFPSLYTNSEDRAGWVKSAVASICEARRKSRKPVYAFVWPYYHPGAKKAGQAIPASYWKLELETVYQYADGVVIWGGNNVQANTIIAWDERAPWWVVTKNKLAEWGI